MRTIASLMEITAYCALVFVALLSFAVIVLPLAWGVLVWVILTNDKDQQAAKPSAGAES